MTEAGLKRAFITGATGAVGFALAKKLIDRNWEVTALHRESSDVSELRALGVKLASGDLCSPADLIRAMPLAADAVFHLAADLSLWKKGDREQYRTNVLGTRYLVDAALQNDPRRFVHTSTISAFGRQTEPISEKTLSIAGDSPVGYEKSKWLAEEEVRAGVKRGLDAVIVNPCAILGPGIRTGWAMIFRQLKTGSMKALPPGDVVVNHIDDVADALIHAFERGRRGENYILTGETASFAELIKEAANRMDLDLKAPVFGPKALAAVGTISSFIADFTGKQPDMTPEMAALMSQKLKCRTTKAKIELGYRETPWRQCVAEMHEWLTARGEL